MAEAALFIGWGEPARGREKDALEKFKWSRLYYERLQKERRIERFELAFLTPHMGSLMGFILVRGTAKQIDSLRHDEEFRQWVNRVRMIVDDFGVVDASVDERITVAMGQYQDAIRQLD